MKAILVFLNLTMTLLICTQNAALAEVTNEDGVEIEQSQDEQRVIEKAFYNGMTTAPASCSCYDSAGEFRFSYSKSVRIMYGSSQPTGFRESCRYALMGGSAIGVSVCTVSRY